MNDWVDSCPERVIENWNDDKEPQWFGGLTERISILRFADYYEEFDNHFFYYEEEGDPTPNDLLLPELAHPTRKHHPAHKTLYTYIVQTDIEYTTYFIELFRLCNCPTDHHYIHWTGQVPINKKDQFPQLGLLEALNKLPEQKGKKTFEKYYRKIHNLS